MSGQLRHDRLASVSEAAEEMAALMTGVVDNRIRMWSLVSEMTSRPDDAVVRRLASGEWVADVREAVHWLGDSAERFRPGLQAVEDAMAAHTVTLADLTAGHEAIVAGQRLSLEETISGLDDQLAAERRAWSCGDVEYAKTLRLAEHDQLHKRIVPALQQWSHDALHQQTSPVLAALMKVVAVVLSMETGRDFERGLEGREFRITDDMP